MRRIHLVLLIVSMPLVTAASCGQKANPTLQQDDGFAAEDQTDSMSEAAGESVLLSSLTEAPTDVSTAENAAQGAAEGASAVYGDCVTHTVDENVVTYNLQNCTGPWGYLTITGTAVATYNLVAPGSLRAQIEATGLTVNDGVADLSATVVRTIVDGAKQYDVTTSWVGRNPKGDVTSRNGGYQTSVDAAGECLSLEGDWITTVGLVSWDTTVDSFRVCRGECPDAGGVVIWSGQRGRELRLEYDGTSTATWTNSNDESGEVQLACGRV